jgi:hypothetical protein
MHTKDFMIALINTQRTLANLHKAMMLMTRKYDATTDTELMETIDSVTSILVLYLKEHTPTVTQEQFRTINNFNAWVDKEAKRRLA